MVFSSNGLISRFGRNCFSARSVRRVKVDNLMMCLTSLFGICSEMIGEVPGVPVLEGPLCAVAACFDSISRASQGVVALHFGSNCKSTLE